MLDLGHLIPGGGNHLFRVAKALGPQDSGAGKIFEEACVLVPDPTSDRKDVT